MPDSIDLGVRECEQLLRPGGVGRIAVSTPTGPHILPVSYSFVGDTVVVRTSPYSVLGTYGRDAVVALEADRFDQASQRGWSIVARGRATVVTDPSELAEIDSAATTPPTASGSCRLVLRIHHPELSGRRLGAASELASSPPFRPAV